jgi:hypothetical protein
VVEAPFPKLYVSAVSWGYYLGLFFKNCGAMVFSLIQ